MSQKFFLYARKSTDVEDKQVLSIDAQITELRTFAKNEKLEIIEEFVEKRTAKIPGRPIFGEMMKRIEKGEVSGILSWHPDRLARNSVDGGQIIYFLDIGKLASLKFPSHWFENTPQGKFSLSMAFVQSKYYVKIASDDDLFAKKVKAKEIFGSNLLLGEKTVRACALNSDSFLADSLADFGRNSGETQWACLRHAHALARSEPLSSILVPFV